MGGECFYPIIVFGYKATTKEELRNLKRIYAECEDATRQLDLFYCSDYAYTRWEGKSPARIWRAEFEFDLKYKTKSTFAVLGIKIPDVNTLGLQFAEPETRGHITKQAQNYKTLAKLVPNQSPQYYMGVKLAHQMDMYDLEKREEDEVNSVADD